MDPERGELELPSAGRVLKRLERSVPRTRGHGRKDEPSLTAICSLAWDRQQLQTSLYQRNTLVRKPGQLRHRQNAGTRQLAKKTNNLTPVEKERRHRFGTRL